MPIDYSKVNIGLGQFQALSSGEHNAGEVRLVNENTIDKVNNFVFRRHKNTVAFALEEVLAIKNAFVNSLSKSGVDGAELNKVRRELGLASENPADSRLHERSIKPLTRQQIREILDRNAGAINQKLGEGTIRTSNEIYGGVGEEAGKTRRRLRNETNAELPWRRDVGGNAQVSLVQSVIAGDVVFCGANERKQKLEKARECLRQVLDGCHGQPRGDRIATVKMDLGDGKSLELSTGQSEEAFLRKLEDMIVRLSRTGFEAFPTGNDFDVRDEFSALATQEERKEWANELADDQHGAFRARVAAVMIMQDHGIGDEATLSVVNNINDAAAIALVKGLILSATGLHGDELRQCACLRTALQIQDPGYKAARNPLGVPTFAFIPAVSDKQFNEAIINFLTASPEKLPGTFLQVAKDVAASMKERFGALGYDEQEGLTSLFREAAPGIFEHSGAGNPGTPRFTPETLRGSLMAEALDVCAKRVLAAGIGKRLGANGGNGAEATVLKVGGSLCAREPAVMQRIKAAASLEAADAVLDDFAPQLAECARRSATCTRCRESLVVRAEETLARKLGVPVECIGKSCFSTGNLVARGGRLEDKIGNGSNGADTDGEIESAFRSLADEYVKERLDIFAEIDKEEGIPAEAKDELKVRILGMANVKFVNIGEIARAARKISPDTLFSRLSSKAPDNDIFDAMRDMNALLEAEVAKLLAGADAIAAVDKSNRDGLRALLLSVVMPPKQGLEKLVTDFLKTEAVAGQFLLDTDSLAFPAITFRTYLQMPVSNAAFAAKLGTKKLPPLCVKALLDAARAEGFGDLSADDALDLFSCGNPAGDRLRAFVKSSPDAVRASALGEAARAALRDLKDGIRATLQAKRQVEAGIEAFLAGECAGKALADGFTRAELKNVARAVIFLRAANPGMTEAEAYNEVSTPYTKANRLLQYGGNFLKSAANFACGLRLMDDFQAWYGDLRGFYLQNRHGLAIDFTHADTPTKLNINSRLVGNEKAVEGLEAFVFRDLASDPEADLSKTGEALFGVENNATMRLFVNGHHEQSIGSLVSLPPEKRRVLYAAFDALVKPVKTAEEAAARNDALSRDKQIKDNMVFIARAVKYCDTLAERMETGPLTAKDVFEVCYPDIEHPARYDFRTINDFVDGFVQTITAECGEDAVEPVFNIINTTGCWLGDAIRSYKRSKPIPVLPDLACHSYELAKHRAGAATQMGADLTRGNNYGAVDDHGHFMDGQVLLDEAALHNTLAFPDNETVVVELKPEGAAAAARAAEKAKALCGKGHTLQTNTVTWCLTQSAKSLLRHALENHGVYASEHVVLDYALSKDNETGAVTIRYSSPNALPVKFSWTTTVAVDGSSTTTPLVVET